MLQGDATGHLNVYSADKGTKLASIDLGTGILAAPMTYEVRGEQYIAVQAGWGIDAQRMQNGIDALEGNVTLVPQGGTIMVFKLEK